MIALTGLLLLGLAQATASPCPVPCCRPCYCPPPVNLTPLKTCTPPTITLSPLPACTPPTITLTPLVDCCAAPAADAGAAKPDSPGK